MKATIFNQLLELLDEFLKHAIPGHLVEYKLTDVSI